MRLFGKNPVIERLRSHPETIRKIHIQQGHKDAALIYKKAKQHGIPIVAIQKTKLQKIGRNTNTQGIVVDITDFEYKDYDEMLEYACKKNNPLLFLDDLNDPQNFGAIIRSLGCLGDFSIIIPTHNSVSITEAVLRVASGGDNYVQIAKVPNLNNAIKKAKEEGVQIVGAVVKGGEALGNVKFKRRVGVVVGSEQKGIRPIIKKQIDLEVSIPMKRDTMSFNVAHAATILAYEITRQKRSA